MITSSYMESQDTATLFLFKIWPAIEANKKRILWGAGAFGLLVLVILIFSWQRDQKEINAGQAFTQLMVSVQANTSPAQLASGFLKVASDYAGTAAAQRAQLQGAADLFTAGNYADAQTQFQKFADDYPNSPLMATAELGLASTLEALGKTDAALDAYKKTIENYSDLPAQMSAKFSAARIYEQQGKSADAIRYYEEVSRNGSGSTLGQQAMLKAVELKATLPAPAAPAHPAFTTTPLSPVVPPSK
jgi:predicted negative regulator of RcsB-dependent stress response